MKGGGTPGYVCYGATKRGLPQMTDSLVAELEKGVQGYPKKKIKGKVITLAQRLQRITMVECLSGSSWRGSPSPLEEFYFSPNKGITCVSVDDLLACIPFFFFLIKLDTFLSLLDEESIFKLR